MTTVLALDGYIIEDFGQEINVETKKNKKVMLAHTTFC